MLTGVKRVQFKEEDQVILLHVEFMNGDNKYGIWTKQKHKRLKGNVLFFDLWLFLLLCIFFMQGLLESYRLKIDSYLRIKNITKQRSSSKCL